MRVGLFAGWWPTYPVAHICLRLADVGPLPKAAITKLAAVLSSKGVICLSRAPFDSAQGRLQRAVYGLINLPSPLPRAAPYQKRVARETGS